MAALIQDIRYGARLLVRHRGFTVVAALVLALGIGANTAVFTVINGMLLKPRPGVADSELASVFSRDRSQADTYRAFSYPNYADLRDRQLFASLAAHNYAMVGVAEGTTTRRVFADVVTANYFDTFGSPLFKGRAFTLEEERPGAEIPVAIVSYGAFQRMGGTDAVIGSTVRVNGRVFNIVGVAPRGFGGPMVIITPELFLPTGVYDSITNDFLKEGLPTTLSDRRHHALVLAARFKPGDSIASVTPALAVASAQLEKAYPGENHDQSLLLAPMSRMSVSTRPDQDTGIGTMVVLLFSMSGLVLLVASFNLANMLLARGSSRQKEFAVRLALGGSRFRLVRQLLAENVVLALVGGAVATVAAWWATRLLTTSLSTSFPVPLRFDTAPDVNVMVATIGLCLFAALLFGLGPALRHARTDAVPELKDQAGEIAGGRRRSRFAIRNVLVMGQLALSLVTLTAAGLFIRSAMESADADPGFTLDRGIMANVDPSLAGANEIATRQFYEKAMPRLRSIPGVVSASLGSQMPFSEFTSTNEVQKPGAPLRKAATGTQSMGTNADAKESVEGLIDSIATSIGADYFKTIGLELKRGREFTTAEELTASENRIAIIDETLAERLFGKSEALDQLVQWQVGRADSSKTVVARVVGVVAPSHHQLLESEMWPHIYTPLGQDFRSSLYIHLKTSQPTADAESAMLPDIRRELLAVEPSLPIIALETRPMFRERNFVLWILRAGAAVFLAFGALALFMSVIGVYGVKSYVVARRTREIGIRVALGATPRNVVGMVVRDGFVTTVIGLTIGLGLSILAGLVLRNLLFGDARFDAPVIFGAIVALGISAALAAWLPARRATRVAPTMALRTE
ncbi:MAG TPA: ABC transporter permease [Vicinamibacterales bacterium]|nr:ABC transporter permease [Vicinamibacterales bacterium]